MIKRKYIIVNGIVQGVGFRPFIYGIAYLDNIKGFIKNTCDGVEIEAEGEEKDLDKFIRDIYEKKPEVSIINYLKAEEVDIVEDSVKKYQRFDIIGSGNNNKGNTIISPDIAVCDKCLKELMDVDESRRYLYSFINCTNCGPRYTIIKKLPYDRANTTMHSFTMCRQCSSEYHDVSDRRFHAEPTCCRECGPSLSLVDKGAKKILCSDELKTTRQYIRKGRIIAVKGIGGFNLICDGHNEAAIENLRRRKLRKSKPLALMMRDVETVRKYCVLSEKEFKIINGRKKPIILLRKKNNKLPYNIAFDNYTLGVLLPYSPLHYMLFDKDIDVIVFTSGNISSLPVEYTNCGALSNLGSMADYFLMHNRDINTSIDDSVVKVCCNKEIVIRNGRGYAPVFIKSSIRSGILCLGSELKNTFAISSGSYIIISPYVGDMENVQTIDRFKKVLELISSIYDITVNTIVQDNHPYNWGRSFMSDESVENNIKIIGVYHHHAHIVSCMYENHIADKVIGLAFDGTGYGDDKKIWGGEFLICTYMNYIRCGHIKYMKMCGGDSSIKEPSRMAASFIYNLIKGGKLNYNRNLIKKICGQEEKYKIISSAIENNINAVETSSMGRLFDIAAVLMGFEGKISYEGEAAIYTENLADKYIRKNGDSDEKYEYKIYEENDEYIIDTDIIILNLLSDLNLQKDTGLISLKFHNTVCDFSFNMCSIIRKKYGINYAALSGGTFQNSILLRKIKNKLELNDFKVIMNGEIPCNDSGISVGQMIIADQFLKD